MISTRLIHCAGALVAMFAAGVQAATYQYVAQTVAPVRLSGAVTAAGINWNCVGNRCTTTGPWPTPEVAACQALARQVGPVIAYGHKAKMLQPIELQQCNAGLAAAPPPARTSFTQKAITTGQLELIGQRFTPKTITTSQLELIGQRFTPKTITTGQLELIGQRSNPKSITPGQER